jgi:hypothetical protein
VQSDLAGLLALCSRQVCSGAHLLNDERDGGADVDDMAV